MSTFTRRQILQTGAVAGGAAMASGLGLKDALAANFPSKAFSMYVAAKAGGGFDRATRGFGPEFERVTGQPMKVIFTPGAGGVLTATKLLTAQPDGHSLAYVAFSSLNVAIHVGKPPNFSYDSFAHLGTAFGGPLAIFVGKNSKYNSLEDLMEASKKGRVTAGISGAREWYHVGGLILNSRTGGNITYVPYGGGGPSRKAAASGEADAVMTGLFDAANQYDVLKCLCIFADKNPIPHLIQAPTMKEIYGDKKGISMMHPSGVTTSVEVKNKNPDNYAYIVDAFKKAATSDATRDRMIKSGFPKEALMYWSPEEVEAWQSEFLSEVKKISF
jgi:tripartite-type tricarboxylate transporter receptor subunit TctC